MKNYLLKIINEYLEIFPEESERLKRLVEFIHVYDDSSIIDWNNFDGHVVASGFIYSKKDRCFLVLYHNDLKMYLYPGGHIDITDTTPLEASKREIFEETGLTDLKQLYVDTNKLVPIDVDTHLISYNERLSLPEHYHFDFRYLFIIDEIENINIDGREIIDYKWISIDELRSDVNYGKIAEKIEKMLKENKYGN